MKRLSDVQLVAETANRELAGRLSKSWEHVEDILRRLLPGDYDLRGNTKLIVCLPLDVPVEPEWTEGGGFIQIRLGGFDADSYFARGETEQASAALDLIANGFARICELLGVDGQPLMAAVAQVRATDFRYEFAYKKLVKSHPSRTVRCEIVVTHRRGGTDVHLRVRSKLGSVLQELQLVSGAYWWPTVHFDFFRSHWVGDSFVVVSRGGEESLRFDASAFVQHQNTRGKTPSNPPLQTDGRVGRSAPSRVRR